MSLTSEVPGLLCTATSHLLCVRCVCTVWDCGSPRFSQTISRTHDYTRSRNCEQEQINRFIFRDCHRQESRCAGSVRTVASGFRGGCNGQFGIDETGGPTSWREPARHLELRQTARVLLKMARAGTATPAVTCPPQLLPADQAQSRRGPHHDEVHARPHSM